MLTINIFISNKPDQDRMMRKKMGGGGTQSIQLGFDFEFKRTVATIERIQVAAEIDEGEKNADWKHSTAGSRSAGIEAGNTGIRAQGPIRLAGVENPRPMGDEFPGTAKSPGGGRIDRVHESTAGSAESRAEDFAGIDDVARGRADGSRDSGPERDRDGVIAQDYVITDMDRLGEGGAKTKYRDNIAALKVLKRLHAEGRVATPADQAVLVKYVGWGGLPQAFDPRNPEWQKEFSEVAALLTKLRHSSMAIKSVHIYCAQR